MRNYLSYGGGVNSTAMYLALMDEGMVPGDAESGFEAIYVDHGCDWPETREYVKGFAEKYPLTVLTPTTEGFSNIYDYAANYRLIPSRRLRWCTDKFKVRVINAYVKKPCFSLIGFSSDESHRAKLSTEDEIENRFPLLEREIDRDGCIKIIQDHGLEVPIKSGCWFCPFQRVGQWRKLRKDHPDLFCKAKTLEENQGRARALRGKGPLYLVNKKPLESVLKKQMDFFEPPDPPCQCGL
jgi:hypothetical protein